MNTVKQRCLYKGLRGERMRTFKGEGKVFSKETAAKL